MRIPTFGAVIAAALCLASCNGGTTVAGASGTCNPPSGIQTVLVYPAPGSTGIPDNVGLIVLGSTAALPAGFQIFAVNVTTQNTLYFNTVGVAPNPIPSPNATPPFANPIYQASGNPGTGFVPGSTIAVYLNNANSSCVPTTTLGSFVVQ